MDWLHKNEYQDLAPEGCGEQINVDHVDCPAGLDTKKRLYVKRTEDGNRIVAYCHHCGKRGSIDTSINATIDTLKRKHALAARNGRNGARHYKIPHDATGDTTKWPSEARVWVYRFGITDKEVIKYGIVYSSDIGRVLLPVYDNNGLASYQARRIHDEDDGAKYITRTNRGDVLWRSHDATDDDTVVLCEDILSGIRIGRILPARALLGTTISERGITQLLAAGYTKFIVFLDDDNADVCKKQLILKNRLDTFGTARIIHSRGKDPKEYTKQELTEVLL